MNAQALREKMIAAGVRPCSAGACHLLPGRHGGMMAGMCTCVSPAWLRKGLSAPEARRLALAVHLLRGVPQRGSEGES